MQSAFTSAIKPSKLKWNRHDSNGSQLSCSNVLKFDWYCQLSGSRSNSFIPNSNPNPKFSLFCAGATVSGCTVNPPRILLPAMSLPRTQQTWRKKKSPSVTILGKGSVRYSFLSPSFPPPSLPFPAPSSPSFPLPLLLLPHLLLPLLLLLKWSQVV